ncbi:MAG: hypothetical protein KAQ72_15935 [Desulfobacula sp.]|nr:hypothetical protein [Desulfobacula sp.]
MKKINKLIVVLIVFMGFVWGCGQGKYDDVVKVNDEYISVLQDYIDRLNKAQTGKDVAKAMNKYTDAFKKLAPKMKKINEKYPELMNAKDLPEKVKQSQAKATQIGLDFASSFMKTMKYITDPGVAQAQKRMGEVMQSLQK